MQEPKTASKFAIQFKLKFPESITRDEVNTIRNLKNDEYYNGYKFSSGSPTYFIYGKNQYNTGILMSDDSLLDSSDPDGEIAKYINDQIEKNLPESEKGKNGMIMRGDDKRGGGKSRVHKKSRKARRIRRKKTRSTK